MAYHHIDVVLADELRPVENLLHVELEQTAVALGHDTLFRGELAEIRVCDRSSP